MDKKQKNQSFFCRSFLKKNRGGELTTQQIVMLVILITSFTVILFLLFRLNLGKETEKEICHNSVIMRGGSVLPSETISLNCHTSYICITEDGSCEKMTKPDIKKVKTKEEVYGVLADEMADCWWMFGEGKVNYVGGDTFSELYCSICSQIAFDDSVKDKIFNNGTFNEKEVYDYLQEKEISKKKLTYTEYLYGVKDFSKVHSGPFKEIDINRQQYIMMGIYSDAEWDVLLIGGGVGLIVVSALAAPFSGGLSVVGVVKGVLILSAAVSAGSKAGSFVAGFGKGVSGDSFLRPTILEVNSEEFKVFKCDYVSTLA